MSMPIESAVTNGMCECGSFEDHASDMEVIRHDVWSLRNQVQELIDLIEPIKDELTPMLESFASSPIAKMLGVSNG